jgi:ATP-dependent DNA helicase RecG
VDNNLDITKILFEINNSMVSNIFIDVENHYIELKDLSTGDKWKSFNESVCAFLNTNGGYIICGIREMQEKGSLNKAYYVSGFDKNNEAKLVDLAKNTFKDDNDNFVKDISEYIHLEYHTLANKDIALIKLLPLRKDIKYVKYNNAYWERQLTSDVKISDHKLKEQKEYKNDYLYYSKELKIIEGCSINDLDVNKVNDYIYRLRNAGSNETIKKEIEECINFLERKNCLQNANQISTLGLLLFGLNPFDKLEYRTEIDCYYKPNTEIGEDKKYFQNDLIKNIEDAFIFVWNHIKVGRTQLNGGQSLPEFSEKLIREVINNSVAHRDYTINKPITIIINPNNNISISNPGNFKQKMIIQNSKTPVEIRRIKSGIVETQNPKLANILKLYDKIESLGIGISTLVSECLENNIDVPYYNLSVEDQINLVIPSGKLIDLEIEFWLNSFDGFITEKLNGNFTFDHKAVLAYFFKSQKLNAERKYTILLSQNNNHLAVLNELVKSGLLVELLSVSTESTPIYVLSSIISKTTFFETINTFVNDIKTEFSNFELNTLNIIYRNNYFNKKWLKPSNITPEMYYLENGKYIDPKKYESLGRKVRAACTHLFESEILTKNKNGALAIKTLDLK